jgi:hypothetical protein
MATELLATGATAAADSTPLTVSAGTPVTVCLKGLVGADARVRVRLKDDAAAYQDVGELTSSKPALAINAPGVYLFTRDAGTCGVFSA